MTSQRPSKSRYATNLGFDWPEQTNPDVWIQEFIFTRVDGSELVVLETWGPALAIDALIVDDETGDEVPFEALDGYRETYARASIKSKRTGVTVPTSSLS